MEFSQWLFHQYLAWQAGLGQHMSVTAFAAYVGISQPQMAAYLKGAYLPKGENLGKMASVLGVEIYDVMGMPRPADRESPLIKWATELLADPQMAEFMKTINAMSVELRDPMLDFATHLILFLYRIPDPAKRRKIMQRLLNFEHQISDEEARDLLGDL
jgi:hypothetical protein